MMRRSLLTVICLMAQWLVGGAQAIALQGAIAPREAPHVRVDLVAAVRQVQPGDEVDLLLRQSIDDGWHTYWLNPGDSGAAPDITWTLPTGVTVGGFHYPYPERIPYGPLMNFGYHHEVLLPFRLKLDAAFEGNSISLEGSGRVLVCADICIPEKVSVQLTLPVGPTELEPDTTGLFDRAWAKVPVPLNVGSSFQMAGDKVRLTVGLPAVQGNRIESVSYFPFTPDLIDNPAPQSFSMTDQGLVLVLEPGYEFDPATADFSGILVVAETAGEGLVSSYEFQAGPGGPAAEMPAEGISFLAAVLFAFLGGLILNLMPCVFPVLSIKILSLVESVHHEGSSIRMHGLAYAAGVVASFVAIAAVLIALRAGGQAIGWGFQLQSPVVVSLLAYLFLVIGLNLLGLFEVGGSLMSIGNGGGGKGYLGSISTGVLATIVAAPCTAPFMGAAVGYALLQAPLMGVLVFASLGVGMALPYVLLCYAPALLARLPRPGNWMVVMKQLLAFPMLASAVWLLWVLGIQAGPTAMMQVLAGCLMIAFAIWLLQQTSHLMMKLATLVLFAAALYLGGTQETASTAIADNSSNSLYDGVYSPAALDAARDIGPVFVNFTAAWCITCKVNEVNALDVERVRQAFADKGVTVLKGDWTNEDPEITKALQAYGRSGVPLYLLYEKNADTARVLPQVLTPGIVLDALNAL